MRLVEAVPGEVLHQIEDVRRLLLLHAALFRAVDELGALLLHHLRALLPHRLAQDVGFAECEAGEHVRDAHHLFLISDDAVGLGQNRLELGQLVRDLDLPLLARDEVVHHAAAQRTRTVERVQRDQIFETLRLGFSQNLAHPAALELEDAVGLPFLENLIRLGIVERNAIDVELFARGPLDLGDRVGDERQRAQAEEVHLQQTDALDLLHGPLGRDFVARPLVERRIFGDRLGRDNDARGVDRGVARHPLETPGDAQQLLDARIGLFHRLEGLAFLKGFLERHVERRGNLLGDLVHVGERHLQHATDVADHRLRLHRAERDDLRDVLAAVLARDVVDHFAAPPLAEIDVDVGQRHALRVQEALEDQIEIEWVDVGDAQAIGDEAAGRRPAARPDRDALLAGVADEVPHDQEVPGVLHLLDHVDFVREPPLVFVDGMAERAGRGELPKARQPLGEPFARDVLEIAIRMPAGSAAAAVWLAMTGYGLLQMYYGLVYAAIQDVAGPEMRGRAMATYFVVTYLGGASWGPLVTGRLSDFLAHRSLLPAEAARAVGLHDAMYVIPALAVVLAAVLWQAGRRPVAARETEPRP